MKRPLLCAAFAACLICAVLIRFFAEIVTPRQEFTDRQIVSMSISLERTEIREKVIYIFAKREGHSRQILIVAYRTDFAPDKFEIGKSIDVKCRCRSFERARNFGGFDEKEYYNSIGIFEKFELMETKESYGKVNGLKQFLLNLSLYISTFIKDAGNRGGRSQERASGALAAIISGDRSGVDDSLSDLYRVSGIYHILAVSGLHISFLGMGVFSMLRKRIGIYAAFAAAVVSSALFCIMSGNGLAAVRAVIMLTVRLGAVIFGKKYDMCSSMSLAAILLLIHEPYYITCSAFRLSFAAVFAAAAAVPVLREIGEKVVGLRGRAASFAGKAFGGVIKSAFTLPVICNMYYGFPVYGALLNLMLMPAASWILAFGAAGAAMGLILPAAGRFLLAPAIYILMFIERICSGVAALPGNYIVSGRISTGRVLLYYAVLFFAWAAFKMILRKRKRICSDRRACRAFRRKMTFVLPAILVSAALILGIVVLYSPGRNNLEIFCIDVDQGQCIVIRTPQDHVYMFDAGSTSVDNVWRYRISSALKYEGICQVDAVFLSHPDTDHISAVAAMLDDSMVEIGTILTPQMKGNDNYEKLVSDANGAGVTLISLEVGIAVADGDFKVTCLYPGEGVDSSDANEHSAVLSITWHGFSALMTGDIGQEQEKLLEREEGLLSDYDLYVAGHHGSRYSNSSSFIKTVSPKITLISAGVENSYGHPHPETIERLEESGSEIWLTAKYGEIVICVSDDGIAGVVGTRLEP